MKKLLFSLCIALILQLNVFANDNIRQVFKIQSYQFNNASDAYLLSQYGSAVSISNGIIYTNAHVVLDEDNEPLNNYRVCKTYDFKQNPTCFGIAKLLYFDTKNDLAILQLDTPTSNHATFSHTDPEIGQKVSVYGYPQNGGDTITYTEGKISGFEDGLYKIDANIDAGNSGGGVFDSNGNLIGIAVSVKLGYTTLGYMIPIDTLKSFRFDATNNIDNDVYSTDEDFLKYHATLKKNIGNAGFSNKYVSLDKVAKYGFIVEDYSVDTAEDFYAAYYKNKETEVYIGNVIYEGTDMTIDRVYKEVQDVLETHKEETGIVKSKVLKRKLYGKNTVIAFRLNKEGEVAMYFTIESSKNIYQSVSIYGSSIKDPTFIKGLKAVLYGLKIHDTSLPQDSTPGYTLFDNTLQIPVQNEFYIEGYVSGDSLKYGGDDIEIMTSATAEIKYGSTYGFEKNQDMQDLAQFTSDVYGDLANINIINVQKSKQGALYEYILAQNNISKSGTVYKDADKYFISAKFYQKADHDSYYAVHLQFSFNKKQSRNKIDEFLKGIRLGQGSENAFEIGDAQLNKNIYTSPDFEF